MTLLCLLSATQACCTHAPAETPAAAPAASSMRCRLLLSDFGVMTAAQAQAQAGRRGTSALTAPRKVKEGLCFGGLT